MTEYIDTRIRDSKSYQLAAHFDTSSTHAGITPDPETEKAVLSNLFDILSVYQEQQSLPSTTLTNAGSFEEQVL